MFDHLLLYRFRTSDCTENSSGFRSFAINVGNQPEFSKCSFIIVTDEGKCPSFRFSFFWTKACKMMCLYLPFCFGVLFYFLLVVARLTRFSQKGNGHNSFLIPDLIILARAAKWVSERRDTCKPANDPTWEGFSGTEWGFDQYWRCWPLPVRLFYPHTVLSALLAEDPLSPPWIFYHDHNYSFCHSWLFHRTPKFQFKALVEVQFLQFLDLNISYMSIGLVKKFVFMGIIILLWAFPCKSVPFIDLCPLF